MASTQGEMNEDELSLDEKAILDEIMKQAVCSSESEELLNESIGLDTVTGALKNQTKGPLCVMARKIFETYVQVVKDVPDPLTSAGGFVIGAIPGKVVKKAAVVYSGKNRAGVLCGWLLAFAHISATERRIYGECGPKKKFYDINWAKVEQNLNKAGVNVKVYDKETGTSLVGSITGSGGKSAVAAAYLG